MRHDLTPGRIRTELDRVWFVVNRPNYFAIEIDLISKYPGLTSSEIMDDRYVEFTILPSKETLRIDERTKKDTRLIVHGDFRRWHFMTEASRYTWRIVGYMYPP